ncbi:MAG: hypothetical protein CMA63_03240 [Euryarchaeota archaeon]|nr:hypothetical protein [Euryarchaeota archaeon]|tara:strand:- start:1659 stop:2159 length:501 start_codon:yes stop_codon:yes gene_type:complete
METNAKISITARDVEIDLDGAASEIEERLIHLRQDDTWGIMLDRLREARTAAMKAAVEAAEKSGLPERGSAFRTLIETCSLSRKPDQVLGAIHYLREVESVMDSPPRVINQLFEDANIESPGNLSLYLNRLRERKFLTIPDGKEDKNRFALLTELGRTHLDKRSNS